MNSQFDSRPLRVCILQIAGLKQCNFLNQQKCASDILGGEAEDNNQIIRSAVESMKNYQYRHISAALENLFAQTNNVGGNSTSPTCLGDNLVYPSSKKIHLMSSEIGQQCMGCNPKFLANSLALKSDVFDMLVLPEMWNCPYNSSSFFSFSEEFPDWKKTPQEENEDENKIVQICPKLSPSLLFLQKLALTLKAYVVGGSIPEREFKAAPSSYLELKTIDDHFCADSWNVYNSCCVFGPDGNIVAVHRKIHLFDIDIPKEYDDLGRGMKYKESDSLAAGNAITRFSIRGFGTVCIGICYDLRFQEFFAASAKSDDTQLICLPGSFNTTTGPKHWELLLRARAVDNQLYVIGCAPAATSIADSNHKNINALVQDEVKEYPAYGHSLCVNPYAKVIGELGTDEGFLFVQLERKLVQAVRRHIPIRSQMRPDVYNSPI